MAHIELLMNDLKLLKRIFPKDHDRFRISQPDDDHLICRFIRGNSEIYEIHATIPVILFWSLILKQFYYQWIKKRLKFQKKCSSFVEK